MFDLFGGLFDFDGNGKVDFGEELLGLMIMNECLKEQPTQTLFEEDDDICGN